MLIRGIGVVACAIVGSTSLAQPAAVEPSKPEPANDSTPEATPKIVPLPNAPMDNIAVDEVDEPESAVALQPKGPPRVDAETGRDLANFPPHPLFDYVHMRLTMDIADMEAQTFRGEESLAAVAIGVPRERMVLDAGPGMAIESVYVDGLKAKFTHEHEKLDIEL